MTERWGIKGDGWSEIRPIPLGEQVARGWCIELSTRGKYREPMTLYRDDGAGWVVVQTYPVGAAERGGDR